MARLASSPPFPLSNRLKDNLSWLNQALGIEKSFDIIAREIKIGGKQAVLIFLDGFTKDEVAVEILKSLQALNRQEIVPNVCQKLVQQYIPYTEIETTNDRHHLVGAILAGQLALLLENLSEAILIDIREYPGRTPEEPDLEKIVRGSRDGFVETLVFNTALIRRRLRDPRLRVENVQVGKRSRTDVGMVYIEDIANPELVKRVRERLSAVKVDGLPMAEKTLEEYIVPGKWWNPFPRVRYTERPDVAAVHLLEGHVIVLVDTSPSAMIIPATFFHHLQHAEEFRQNPAVGGFLRGVRLLGVLASLFIVPLWLLVSLEPELLPANLKFIGPQKMGEVPLAWQFLIIELGFNLMRLAGVHTPAGLSTALSIIAALLIGEIAIRVGLFAPEVVLYGAVAAVATYATPSYELGMANSITRIFLILATGFARLPGLVGALALLTCFLTLTKSFGIPYFWPLIPFNAHAFFAVLIRSPLPLHLIRPSILKPRDQTRQPPP